MKDKSENVTRESSLTTFQKTLKVGWRIASGVLRLLACLQKILQLIAKIKDLL